MKHLQLSILLLVLLNQFAFGQDLFKKASAFYKQGEIDSALAYCERSLQEDTATKAKLLSYNLLGVIYKNQKKYNLAIEYLSRGIDLAIKVNNYSALNVLYNNKGLVYRWQYQFSKAKAIFRKVLSNSPNLRTKSSTFNGLGAIYFLEKKYDSAFFYYQKALPLVTSKDKHTILNNIGLIYQNKSKYDSAFYYLSEAYELRKALFPSNHYLIARSVNNLAYNFMFQEKYTWANLLFGQVRAQAANELEILRSLVGRADVLWNQGKKKESLSFYLKASDRALPIRQKIESREDKEYFAQVMGKVNDVALGLSLAIGEYETAFTIAERNKGSILLEITQAKNSLGYSPTISVSEIQEKLNPEQAVLSYAFFSDSLATFLITNDTLVVYRQAKGSIETDCERFYNLSEHIYFGMIHVELGQSLYNRLVAPVASLLKDRLKLLILPEGKLFIPFDALLTKKFDPVALKWHFSKFPYFIRDYTTSYHFSASLAFLPRPERNYPLDYVGIAPVFGQIYRELPHSILEIQGIKARMHSQGQSTDIYVGDDASKDKMKNLQSKIFHIATHYENGGLVLKDGSLTLKELYEENYRIESELAILSGCQTFFGQFVQGEGPVNLVSHFIEAGSENVLFSFTKIYDEAAEQMVDQFFQGYLEQGLSYAEALRAAKLQFLDDSKDVLYPHYSFWAGMGFIENQP